MKRTSQNSRIRNHVNHVNHMFPSHSRYKFREPYTSTRATLNHTNNTTNIPTTSNHVTITDISANKKTIHIVTTDCKHSHPKSTALKRLPYGTCVVP